MARRAARPAPAIAASPALAASSAVQRRAVALYKQKRPTSTCPVGWIDDALWSECYRRARIEIEGIEP